VGKASGSGFEIIDNVFRVFLVLGGFVEKRELMRTTVFFIADAIGSMLGFAPEGTK